MSDTKIHTDFPVEHMIRLNELINRLRWIVPVLPKDSLEILLEASVKLCQTGVDANSEQFQKFLKKGLTTSFRRLMTEENSSLWKSEIHVCILDNSKRLVELCVAKLSQGCILSEDCLPQLDLLALIFSPDCRFYTVNAMKRSSTLSNSGLIHSKTVDESNPRGWLFDLVNTFGELHGFQTLLEIFTQQALRSVQVIAAFIKPFGLCVRVLTDQTVNSYLMPIVEILKTFLDGLSDEELRKLWKSDALSTIVTAMEELPTLSQIRHKLSMI